MKNLCIIGPTFYPHPVVGSVRISSWAKNLPSFDWKPTVLCKHYGYTALPEDLERDISPDVTVRYLGALKEKPAEEFFTQTSLKRRLSNFIGRSINMLAVPDGAIWGWKKLRAKAIDIAASTNPDVILTSSPKHSIHFLGQQISQKLSVPWVADFRDPYLCDVRFRPPEYAFFRKWLHSRFEKSIYLNAAKVIHAIPLAARWYRRRYPDAAHKIELLTNGYPDEILTFVKQAQQSKPNGILKIVAAGRIDDEAVPLMQRVVNQLCQDGVHSQFRHMGRMPKNTPDNNERMHFRGRVPHNEALREISLADLLLIYLGEDRSSGIGLSSKLFEYLVTGKPVIMINPTRSDDLFVRKTPWCRSFHAPTSQQIVKFIHELPRTKTPDSNTVHQDFLKNYSRVAQAKQLATWLNEICEP